MRQYCVGLLTVSSRCACVIVSTQEPTLRLIDQRRGRGLEALGARDGECQM
jgi:hypothetical protein